MITIGLTGKTGAGKSTICTFLKQQGCYIIDTDVIAREIMSDKRVIERLKFSFGSDLFDKDLKLDRKLLASRAFKDETSTELLNQITHPFIVERIKQEMIVAKSEDFSTCVIDAAVLLECEAKDFCDKIVVVTAPQEIRLDRILKRDKIKLEQALERINSQKSDDYYNSHADIIIKNYSPYELEDEMQQILKVMK